MWPTQGQECGSQGTLTLVADSTLHSKELLYSNNNNNLYLYSTFNFEFKILQSILHIRLQK